MNIGIRRDWVTAEPRCRTGRYTLDLNIERFIAEQHALAQFPAENCICTAGIVFLMTANEQDIGALESVINAKGGGACLAPAQQRECCIEDVGVSKAGHGVGGRVEGGLAVPDAVQHLWHRF